MVLYKRKQVNITLPAVIPEDLSTEVWYIPQTTEWFSTYEEYLGRIDYYQKRKFVCEITGNSCLTFFEALQSEIKEVKDVEKNFPEALKTHILRFLQFNRITRLDQLVDKVYSLFKNNYFPGEYVLLRGVIIGGGVGEISAMKHRAIIREKVEFSNASAKYLVVREADKKDTIVTGDKLARDRNHFTKWLIKTFIKLTMTRSHKIGAPWVVKDKYAKRYRIDQNYPPDLKQYEESTLAHDDPHDMDPGQMRHFTVLSPQVPLIKSVSPIPGKSTNFKTRDDSHTSVTSAKSLHKQLDMLRSVTPENLTSRNKLSLDQLVKGHSSTPDIKDNKNKRFPVHYLPPHLREIASIEEEGVNCNRPGTIATLQASGIPPTRKNMVDDLKIKFDLQHVKPVPYKFKLPNNSRVWNQRLLELIDQRESLHKSQELETDSKESKETAVLSSESSEPEPFGGNDLLALDKESLKSEHLLSIEDALETWIFLNIYHIPLKIDTFTFDDFVYCMGWNSDQFELQGRCQLLDEIWCGVLGQIVSNKMPSAAEAKTLDSDDIYGLQVTIPSAISHVDPKTEDEDLVKGSESEAENNGKSFTDAEDENSDSDGTDDVKAKKKNPKKKQVKEESVKEESVDVVNVEEADDEAEMEEEEENDSRNDSRTENESDDDDEPKDHNAYQIMDHRGITWHDRLRKRNFRDGNWQTIVLGVLSLVEDIPKYHDTVERVYKVLAPIDEPATASTALSQFYEKMDINLRLKTLNILCSLLATTDMVRSYIDQGLEESTALRRRRLDNIKEFKLTLEQAHRLHNSILEGFLNGIESKEVIEEARKKQKFDVTQTEMTEAETELAAKDPAFAALCNERKEVAEKIDELKKEKKSFERQLVELDCQRVRCLGKDRLYNRYWWFENNGLPTLHGTADADDEEDEKLDDDNESTDEVQEETYLMGKLWIQGPSAEDAKLYFQNASFNSDLPYSSIPRAANEKDELVDYEGNKVERLDFSQLPSDFVNFAAETGLKFEGDSITKTDGSCLIDQFGGIISTADYTTLSPTERKIIEEAPDPLFDGSQWRFYHQKEDLEAIIKWLNPYGIRESQLKKELLSVKDAISFSIDARNKALFSKDLTEDQEAVDKKIKLVDQKLTGPPATDEYDEEDEDVEDISSGRKRNLRMKAKADKRQKRSDEDIIANGTIDELKKLKDDLLVEMKTLEEEKEASRALEWVNSLAIDEFDKSLYEGGDKAKPRSKKK